MVLKYETHPMLENFPSNYLPDEFSSDPDKDTKKQKDVFKFLNTTDHLVTDYSGIPSSSTLLTAESAPIEDMRIFKQKKLDARGRVWGPKLQEKDELKDIDVTAEHPEKQLKRLLPTFTPDENCAELKDSKAFILDYEEALYFGESKYAQMSRYYVALERILTIEWFILKL